MAFKFAAGKCGFKKTGKTDLGIIYSDLPCNFAGVFTTNQVRAACVDENKRLLKSKKKIRAIVVNSGNANACTGKAGIKAVKETQKISSELLEVKPSEIIVASTGGIGVPLDLNKMRNGLESTIPKLNKKDLSKVAVAIMTTDAYKKVAAVKTSSFYINGIAKGAGMIHPDMATMLCYFITNINMSQSLLQSALKEAVDCSFNSISVDGDTSTNDMVVILSDNTSRSVIRSKKDLKYKKFVSELKKISLKLSKQIVVDGEGATRLINVTVRGARKESDARRIARFITTSVLFKCAIFGGDPNWGRALARVGCTNVKVDQNKVTLKINGIAVFKNGDKAKYDGKKLDKEMKKAKEVFVDVDLNLGKSQAVAMGSDLTHDYVEFNSAYFT